MVTGDRKFGGKCRSFVMEDKLKRYEKVEFLGAGRVVKIPATPYLMKQGYILKSLVLFFLYEIHSFVM